MTTNVWHNMAAIPDENDPDRWISSDADLDDPNARILIYLCDATVIEIRPASSVRVTEETVEVMQGRRLIAAYPRERVFLATRHAVEPSPFC